MIRVFKLTNGISIIATVNENSPRKTLIKNVFMIDRRLNESGDIYETLSCYTSYIKDRDDWIDLSKNQIVFSYEPTEEFSKYYLKISETYWTQMVPIMNKIVESYVAEEEPQPESHSEPKVDSLEGDNVVPLKPSKTIH